MRRGDLATVVIQGDIGTSARSGRAVFSVRYDGFSYNSANDQYFGCSTSHPPDRPAGCRKNGLRKPSQMMIDNATTIMRTKIGAPLGDSTMKPWFQSIALWRCFSDLPEETARIICGW